MATKVSLTGTILDHNRVIHSVDKIIGYTAENSIEVLRRLAQVAPIHQYKDYQHPLVWNAVDWILKKHPQFRRIAVLSVDDLVGEIPNYSPEIESKAYKEVHRVFNLKCPLEMLELFGIKNTTYHDLEQTLHQTGLHG